MKVFTETSVLRGNFHLLLLLSITQSEFDHSPVVAVV